MLQVEPLVLCDAACATAGAPEAASGAGSTSTNRSSSESVSDTPRPHFSRIAMERSFLVAADRAANDAARRRAAKSPAGEKAECCRLDYGRPRIEGSPHP